MIDTDDLDRSLRAAFISAADGDATGDPAARVASRVTRRRHRRIATRVGAALVVVAVVAAVVGVTTTRRSGEPPAHPPAPTYATPAVLLTPQTAADRAGIALGRELHGGPVLSSIRLLQSQPHAHLYGARDHAGQFCFILGLDDSKGRPAAFSNCSSRAVGAKVTAAEARGFQLRGTESSTYSFGRWAVAFFLPNGITSVVLDSGRYPVVRNGVLVVAAHHIPVGYHETRIGSTLRVTTAQPPG